MQIWFVVKVFIIGSIEKKKNLKKLNINGDLSFRKSWWDPFYLYVYLTTLYF